MSSSQDAPLIQRYSRPRRRHPQQHPDALAGATTVGHLLECSGQITGGNFEGPGGVSFEAADYADLGFPIAKVFSDGSAEIFLLEGKKGVVDRLTCTLQLLYEVHDPAAYITPDVVIDFTDMTIEEIGPQSRARVREQRRAADRRQLKVSGFVDLSGFIADCEIGYAGTHAVRRARIAADALRMRLSSIKDDDIRIDVVGVNSILGDASLRAGAEPARGARACVGALRRRRDGADRRGRGLCTDTVRSGRGRQRAQRAAAAARRRRRIYRPRLSSKTSLVWGDDA